MESPILSAHTLKSHNNALKLTASVLHFLHIYKQRTACECILNAHDGNLCILEYWSVVQLVSLSIRFRKARNSGNVVVRIIVIFTPM